MTHTSLNNILFSLRKGVIKTENNDFAILVFSQHNKYANKSITTSHQQKSSSQYIRINRFISSCTLPSKIIIKKFHTLKIYEIDGAAHDFESIGIILFINMSDITC